MSNLWAYARELRAKNTLELTEDLATLLADADALLVVAEYVKRRAPNLWKDLEGEGLTAALPKHLKLASNE